MVPPKMSLLVARTCEHNISPIIVFCYMTQLTLRQEDYLSVPDIIIEPLKAVFSGWWQKEKKVRDIGRPRTLRAVGLKLERATWEGVPEASRNRKWRQGWELTRIQGPQIYSCWELDSTNSPNEPGSGFLPDIPDKSPVGQCLDFDFVRP